MLILIRLSTGELIEGETYEEEPPDTIALKRTDGDNILVFFAGKAEGMPLYYEDTGRLPENPSPG